MSRVIIFVVGVCPCLLLAVGAAAMCFFGFAALAESAAVGAGMILWSGAGLAGTWAMLMAWAGYSSENITAGLVAGILAATPLLVAIVGDLIEYSQLGYAFTRTEMMMEMIGWLSVILGPIASAAWLIDQTLPHGRSNIEIGDR